MTDTSTINSSTITKNSNSSSTFFRNSNGNGDLVDCLNVSATGIQNYVPYLPLSNPTRGLNQIGGYIDLSGTLSINTGATSRLGNLTSFTFPIGTYILNSNMRVNSGAVNLTTSPNFVYLCFNTASSGFQNTTIYSITPLEYRANTYSINATTGEFHRHNAIIINLTASTTIYLNYSVQTNTAVACTINYGMNAARIA